MSREYIVFLQKEAEQLRMENAMLKRALLRETAETEVIYREIKDSLDKLKATILRAVINAIKIYERPVNYEEILRVFRTRFPFIRAKTETITRRLRQLREEGILFSPKQGYFYINKETLEKLKK